MVTFRRFNILESLDTEEEIKEFLEGVRQDIEEGECDASFFAIALTDAAKARTINQLVKETGADRQALCDMFLEQTTDGAEAPEISHDVVVKVAKVFDVPVPV
jgi:probable addiction module antidote protein